jgi:hypothetical protein
VRLFAAGALAEMGATAEPALSTLLLLREDPDDDVRAKANEAITGIRLAMSASRATRLVGEPAGSTFVSKDHKAAPSPSGERPTLAVFDVQDVSRTLDANTLEQLSDYVVARLATRFRVVPRTELRTQLVATKAEGLSSCFDERCQIELGKAVAAQKALAVKVLRTPETCTLAATVFDLRTETAEDAATERTPCTSQGLLDGVDRLAPQLGVHH